MSGGNECTAAAAARCAEWVSFITAPPQRSSNIYTRCGVGMEGRCCVCDQLEQPLLHPLQGWREEIAVADNCGDDGMVVISVRIVCVDACN